MKKLIRKQLDAWMKLRYEAGITGPFEPYNLDAYKPEPVKRPKSVRYHPTHKSSSINNVKVRRGGKNKKVRSGA